MSNVHEQKSRFKRAMLILFTVLMATFIMWNAAWISYREFRYAPLIEHIPENQGVRLVSIGDYSDSVKQPDYLEFHGNLALINEKTAEGLIIWPQFLSGYRYGAIINLEENANTARYTQSMVFISENGDWLAGSGQNEGKEKEAFLTKSDEIQEMLNLADEMWNLRT